MKKITILAVVFMGVAAMFVPQDAQAWEAKVQLYRCSLFNSVTICYAASTTVFPTEDSNGHIESCDIKDLTDEGGVSHPGLEVTGNSVYGPNYVNLSPGHDFKGRPWLCSSTTQVARYSGMITSCAWGGIHGYWHVAFHNVRWRVADPDAHAWRGENIATTRSINLPWPVGTCPCDDGSGGFE